MSIFSLLLSLYIAKITGFYQKGFFFFVKNESISFIFCIIYVVEHLLWADNTL